MHGGWNVLKCLNLFYSLSIHWRTTDGKNKDVERNILCFCVCVCVCVCMCACMLCESCVCLCVCMWNKETLKKEEINPVRLARKDH